MSTTELEAERLRTLVDLHGHEARAATGRLYGAPGWEADRDEARRLGERVNELNRLIAGDADEPAAVVDR